MNVLLSTGPPLYNTPTVGTFLSRDFIGFVSDTPITSIFFYPSTGAYDNTVLDNFAFGVQPASPAPEAATLVLCGTGLLFMVARWRRKPRLSAGAGSYSGALFLSTADAQS